MKGEQYQDLVYDEFWQVVRTAQVLSHVTTLKVFCHLATLEPDETITEKALSSRTGFGVQTVFESLVKLASGKLVAVYGLVPSAPEGERLLWAIERTRYMYARDLFETLKHTVGDALANSVRTISLLRLFANPATFVAWYNLAYEVQPQKLYQEWLEELFGEEGPKALQELKRLGLITTDMDDDLPTVPIWASTEEGEDLWDLFIDLVCLALGKPLSPEEPPPEERVLFRPKAVLEGKLWRSLPFS